MNKRQKEVIEYNLQNEADVLKALESQYRKALADINRKIRDLQGGELTQSKIYHLQYQKTLKKQVEAIVEKLHSDEYTSIQQYLNDSYTNSFVGTMYDIAGQGIPIIAPIDTNAAAKAIILDSKVKEDLYTSLGVDITKLKRTIRNEITRGIASGETYSNIARNISHAASITMHRANTIVRTEGHRIQQAATEDARQTAVKKGANVVKQWDATLDGATRKTHRALDGQIRETNERFEADGKSAMYPGDFGFAEEDCNCRCVALTRARAAMDEEELQTMKDRAAYFGLLADDSKEFGKSKAKLTFAGFKEKYMKAAETLKNQGESGKMESKKFIQFYDGKEANDFFYYDDEKRGLLAKKKSVYSQWMRELSTDERECILDYTAGGYGDINDYFRHRGSWEEINADLIKEKAKHIDSAIERFTLKDNITVQRGVMNDFIDKLVEQNDVQNDLSELIGKKFVEEGYTSTTVLFGNAVATTKPTVLEIQIPAGAGRGAYVNELTGFTDVEYEFLIKRGASFTITEVREDVDMEQFYIKMVMDDD